MNLQFDWTLLLPEIVLCGGGVVLLLVDAVAPSTRRACTALAGVAGAGGAPRRRGGLGCVLGHAGADVHGRGTDVHRTPGDEPAHRGLLVRGAGGHRALPAGFARLSAAGEDPLRRVSRPAPVVRG